MSCMSFWARIDMERLWRSRGCGVNRVFASLTEWTLFTMVLGKILGCVHAHKMSYMFAWLIIIIKESSLSRT